MAEQSGSQFSGSIVYSRLLKLVGRYWLIFVLGIVGTILVSAVDALFTWLVKPIIDEGFVNRNAHFIYWLPLILVVVFVLRSACNFISKYFIDRVARSVVMRLRQQVFHHLLKMPASYYDRNSSGYLLSTIVYNVEQVANASSTALITVLREGSTLVGMVVVMFALSWRLSLISLIVVPIMAWLVRTCSKRLRRLSHRVQESVGDVTHSAEEGIEGYKEIRLYGGEKQEYERFCHATELNRDRELKVVIANNLNTSIIQFLIALPAIIILSLATTHLMLSAGSFASIVMAMFGLLRPARRLSDVNSTIQKGIAGAASVFSLLDEPIEEDKGTTTLTRAQGFIEFNHVNFSYITSKKRVLNDIHFSVLPGQTVAFVGHSGSGKSTLMKLLPRFYEPTKGEIKLDGVKLQDYPLETLRTQFAFVSQHITLFDDTIAYNIAYGKQGQVSEEEVLKAAELAHAMEFIKELPNGIHTIIGENGVLLSGGQRQRIAIARAMIKDAPILVLDEATSSLDTHSERAIQEALQELMRDRTTLVIAHRLSTIERANRIIVLEKGRIAEEGTHSELLARGGAYAKLYNIQFKGSDNVSVVAEKLPE